MKTHMPEPPTSLTFTRTACAAWWRANLEGIVTGPVDLLLAAVNLAHEAGLDDPLTVTCRGEQIIVSEIRD